MKKVELLAELSLFLITIRIFAHKIRDRVNFSSVYYS